MASLVKRLEQQIQKAVVEHLRVRAAPNTFFFHVPNGGWRTRTEGAILKGMGVMPGTPDLFLVFQGRCYALEIKPEGGRPTVQQLEVIAQLEKAGAFTSISCGLDAALRVLEAWGLLRGRVQ
jgi:hypothetical protein